MGCLKVKRMLKKIIVLCVFVTFAFMGAAGCDNEGPAVQQTELEQTEHEIENTEGSGPGAESESKPKSEPKSEANAISAADLYALIATEMAYDEVMEIMAGHKPFLQNEGAINTPTGQIMTDNVSWKIGKSIITVIFQDKIVIGKDLTNT